jgi:hypothetical protein
MLLKGNQMLTIDTCSSADVDRLLGLADQFLDDWAEDAVQGGQPDEDYEQRSTEWKAIRPLLVSAPALLRALKQIASFCRGSAAPMAVRCTALVRTAMDGLVDDEPTSQPSSAPDNARAGRVYLESAGKIVDSIRYADEASGWHAFEIRFTDGTFLFIEPVPRVQFQMRYMKTSGGDLETLRDYGTLL